MMYKIPDASLGVNFDLSPEELVPGAWSNVLNVRFKNGYAQKFKGIKQVFTDTSDCRFLHYYQTPTSKFWVHARTNAVFADDGTTRTEITPTSPPTGTANDRWTAATFGGVLVMNNGVDAPYFWNGTTTTDLAALTAWPTTARCATIHAYKNYLVALDITRPKYSRTISTITFVTTTATLTTSSAHGLSTGDSITVSGATPAQYNGTFTVTVTGATTLTYTMGGTPAGNASPVGSYVVNTTQRFPHMVKWSHSATPGSLPDSWDETNVTKDAGEQELAETADFLIDALPLGDQLILYKERSMYSMTFIGQPFIFRFQRIPGSHGMLARGCGAVTPVGHVVLTAGDVVLFNGQGSESIADGKVRKFIFDNLDTTNFRNAFVTTNPIETEVVIAFPQTGSTLCDRAAVWNWKTQVWSLRELPNVTYGATGELNLVTLDTWAADTETWADDVTSWAEDDFDPNQERLLVCSATKIGGFDIGAKDFGSTLTSTLERLGLEVEDGMKLLRGLWPKIDAPAGTVVNITFGASMAPNSSPIWQTPTPFTSGDDVKVDGFAQGRYLAIRFECDSIYRMRSMNLDIVKTGTF